MADKICLREKLGSIFCELGSDERVFVLDTDLAKSTTLNEFAARYPSRFLEMGIAEQSAMSVASGLASEGKVPFYISFAIFTTGTAWTQLRQACYAGLNVKVIGTHPGMDDGPDGASHHANEDLALTRCIPGLTVLTPSSLQELRDSVELAIATPGPFYIRVARDEVPVLSTDSTKSAVGKAVVTANCGNDIAIVYEGSAAMAAWQGYEILREQGIGARLINLYSIKPIDRELLLTTANEVNAIVTVENHSVMGGVGGAVAEVLATAGCVARLGMVGVQDVFTESGSVGALKQKYGICGSNVAATALKLIPISD